MVVECSYPSDGHFWCSKRMKTFLEPREVERPFLTRWSRQTANLFLRSPIRLGAFVALLGFLDTLATRLADGYVIPKIWIDRAGTLLLPILLAIVSAVARGADDASRTWEAIEALRGRRVWLGTLGVGAAIVCVQWIIAIALGGIGHLPLRTSTGYLQQPGELVQSIAAGVVILYSWAHFCYFPLLVLVPGIAPSDARHLARSASDKNGRFMTWIFVALLSLGASALAAIAPAYGMTEAGFLVLLGLFNFVAFRDIFERRAGNLPKEATVSPIAKPIQNILIHSLIGK